MEDSKIVDLYWQRSEEAIPETAAKFGGYCRFTVEQVETRQNAPVEAGRQRLVFAGRFARDVVEQRVELLVALRLQVRLRHPLELFGGRHDSICAAVLHKQGLSLCRVTFFC